MKDHDPIPDKMNLSLERFDAELRTELAHNASNAKILRLLADYVDGRSDAQIAGLILQTFGDDAKGAMAWLIQSRRDIASLLKLLTIYVALESKEQEHFRGIGQ